MTLGDSEIISWILFAKGDIAAHPFHGNQYSTGQSGAEVPRQSDPGRFQVATNRFGAPQGPMASAGHTGRVKSDPTDMSPNGIKQWTKSIHFALLRGEKPIISGQHFPTLIAEMSRQGTKGNDITKLRIDGTRLIGQDCKGYSRVQMPQIDSLRIEKIS